MQEGIDLPSGDVVPHDCVLQAQIARVMDRPTSRLSCRADSHATLQRQVFESEQRATRNIEQPEGRCLGCRAPLNNTAITHDG